MRVGCLTLKFIHQRGLANAGFAGYKNDLSPVFQSRAQIVTQCVQCLIAADESGLSRDVGFRSRGISYGRDKSVTASMQGFNKPWILCVVTQQTPDVQDLVLQYFRLDDNVRPDGLNEFPLRYQTPRLLRQIAKDGIGLRSQQQPVFGAGIRPTPQTLIQCVELKRRKFLHGHPWSGARDSAQCFGELYPLGW